MGRVPSRGSDQFVVRFPEGLRDRIRLAAEQAGRSMNAEIVAALEEKFPAPKFSSAAEELVREWQPRIMAETDPKKREKLIGEANRLLSDLWENALDNENDDSVYQTTHRHYPPRKLDL